MEFEKRGARVEAEAAALAAARHPGVVELAGSDGGVLRTTLIDGGRTLASEGPLTPDEVAGVLASVATTLADLHDRGVVHGGIESGHVLLDQAGRPVLCSLGRGGEPADDVAALGRLGSDLLAVTAPSGRPADGLGRRGGAPSRWGRRLGGRWAVHQAGGRRRWRGGPSARAGRQAGGRWGRRGGPPVWAATAPAEAGGGDPGPGSRGTNGRARRRRRRLGPLLAPSVTTVLAGLVARATATDAADRPTARQLAADVRHGVPTARWPAPTVGHAFPLMPRRPAPRRPRPWSAGRRPEARRPGVGTADRAADDVRRPAAATPGPVTGHPRPRAAGASAPATGRGVLQLAGIVVGAAMGCAALFAAILSISDLLGDRGGGPAGSPARLTADRPAGGADRPASGPAPAAPLDATAATTSIPVAVRVWPPEPPDYRDGVLTLEGVRYQIGQPGDAVAAGDWACSGRTTLALLRPATGEVFAFDAWPADGEGTAARLVATVTGASGLRPLDADGDGCDDLEVARAGSPPVVVEAAP